ncbi:MAG TPA: ferrochelatase, partial [Cellulomonas sp.]|nr:ferrochelatase [Cellulomonas sp.]
GLVDLVLERAAEARAVEAGEPVPPAATAGALPAWHSVCRPGCCRRQDGVDSGVPAACSTDPWS